MPKTPSGLLVIGLALVLSACAGSLQHRYDQLVKDRAYAVAAIDAWKDAYRDGLITTDQWQDGREAYDEWDRAHQAYLQAILDAKEVNRRQGEQALALGHFQKLTASYGIRVEGYE
jgi:hypothetical protein